MNLQPSHTSKLFNPRFALLLVMGFGVLAMLPAYYWGIPGGADLDNHFRFVMPFFDELSHGNFSPGWLAESNNGFGDARFRFYPPLIYYLLSLARLATGEWYFATLIVFTLFSVVGALGIYYWARQSLSTVTSVIAALLFAVIPYHLTQFFQASLLAEFAATALLPFAFMFVERLLVTKSRLLSNSLFNIAGLGISFSLIVSAHVPTMVIASLSLGVFALLLTDWKGNKKALFFGALGIGFGLILSCPLWIKTLSELNWIQAGQKVQSKHYDYRNNFLFSPFSLPSLNTWFGGLVAALTAGIFLPSIVILRRIFSRANEKSLDKYLIVGGNSVRRRLGAAVMVALAALLMTTDLSRPVWLLLPKLKDIQFPFRWLSIVSIVICPVTALAIQVWRERIRQRNIRALHLPIFLAFGLAVFVTVNELVIDSPFLTREIFNERLGEIRGGRSFNDWLPPGAAEMKDLQPLDGQIDPGNRHLVASNWQTHTRRFTLDAGDATQVRLRTYYYPLWKATILGPGAPRPAATSQAPDGTLLVDVPPESCEVEVTFTEPWQTLISFVISALGWTFALVLLLSNLLKGKTSRI